MGTTESKVNHRHSIVKQHRYKNEKPITRKCHHKDRQLDETFDVGNKNVSKGINENFVPLISLPLKPNLQGSVLNYSFPVQRSRSEMQITPNDLSNDGLVGNLNQFDHVSYDYQKHMQRVDEENRPVLEGLCPDKMYVSTNDLRICDTQRLPPPLRCRMTQGFFRPITPTKFHQKKTTFNASFV